MDRSDTSDGARPRRRLNASLRVILIAIALLAVWLGQLTNSWHAQRRAIETIRRSYGSVEFDYQYVGGDPRGRLIPDAHPRAPAWLRRCLGDEPFQKVVRVVLSAGRYRDADLALLEDFPGLRSVSLFNCSNITNDGLKHLSYHSNLTELNVYRHKGISDEGVAHLRGLTRLETLHLDGSSVTDAGLDHLLDMTRLQELDIDGTPVSNAGIVKLGALPALKRVFVQNSRTTDEGAAALKRVLPHVKVELGSRPGSYGQ